MQKYFYRGRVDTTALTSMVSGLLAEAADPGKAAPMAAYMKTDMPFYGAQKKARVPVARAVRNAFPPASHAEYVAAVEALWALPHREEKYIALSYARSFDDFVEIDSLPMYRRLIVDGSWWDFVDEIASKLVGRVLEKERSAVTPIIRSWIPDEELWLRRTSIICQLGHKSDTDTDLLGDACVGNLGDEDFFIRKAIGWALREYAKTDSDWVRRFVARRRGELSALSYREATKHL
jgi:3-methyladenine DNA glycosylase AlkD